MSLVGFYVLKGLNSLAELVVFRFLARQIPCQEFFPHYRNALVSVIDGRRITNSLKRITGRIYNDAIFKWCLWLRYLSDENAFGR